MIWTFQNQNIKLKISQAETGRKIHRHTQIAKQTLIYVIMLHGEIIKTDTII